MIKVAIADDHDIVRKGLRNVLESQPDIEVVAEAADGRAALDVLEATTPDILIVDVMMPGLTGLEVARQAPKRSAATRIIVLSMHTTADYVMQALKAGVWGYLVKGADASEVVNAVQVVSRGQRYLSPEVSGLVMDAAVRGGTAGSEDLYDTLTDREREILQLMAEGATNGQIGERLFISPRTVETHRANVMKKLGLQNQTEVVRYALKRGLLPSDG